MDRVRPLGPDHQELRFGIGDVSLKNILRKSTIEPQLRREAAQRYRAPLRFQKWTVNIPRRPQQETRKHQIGAGDSFEGPKVGAIGSRGLLKTAQSIVVPGE